MNEEFTWCRIFIEDYRKYFDILDRFHLSYESSDGRSILVYEDYVFPWTSSFPSIFLIDKWTYIVFRIISDLLSILSMSVIEKISIWARIMLTKFMKYSI